jgi:hypothetical protein
MNVVIHFMDGKFVSERRAWNSQKYNIHRIIIQLTHSTQQSFLRGNLTVPQHIRTFFALYGAWHLPEVLHNIL